MPPSIWVLFLCLTFVQWKLFIRPQPGHKKHRLPRLTIGKHERHSEGPRKRGNIVAETLFRKMFLRRANE